MTEKTYYERYWKKQFGSYGKGVAETPPDWQAGDLERVLSFCGGSIKGRVLDAGCGDGFFASHLAKMNGVTEVVGVDISDAAVKTASQKHPHLQFRQGELNALPMENDSIDCAAMSEVIEHLVDVDGVLDEIARVLKPGGILLITTTDFNWLKCVLISMFYFEKYFYPTNPHVRFFTKGTLAEVLSHHGLTVIKYGWNGDYFGLMPKGQMVLAKKR